MAAKRSLWGSVKGLWSKREPEREATAIQRTPRAELAMISESQRYVLLEPYFAETVDLDELLHGPASGPESEDIARFRQEIPRGYILVSQEDQLKCISFERIDRITDQQIEDIKARRVNPHDFVYLPYDAEVLLTEAFNIERTFRMNVKKGTVIVDSYGRLNFYLIQDVQIPFRGKFLQSMGLVIISNRSARLYLQQLIDLPESFRLVKDDVFYDPPPGLDVTLEKGTLLISRGGALTGLLLEDIRIPIRDTFSDRVERGEVLEIPLTYKRVPLDSLAEEADRRGEEIPIEKGTFLFGSQGNVYFVWQGDVRASAVQLRNWSRIPAVDYPGVLNLSTAMKNMIGGPGVVITPGDIFYLRDVFKWIGTTNIRKGTLLLERNVLYKFVSEMPFGQSIGSISRHLGRRIQKLNTYRTGAFNVELGGSGVEVSALDFQKIRELIQAEGRILLKLETKLRIEDDKAGDRVYRVKNNVFYTKRALSLEGMEEYVPESIVLESKEEPRGVIVGEPDLMEANLIPLVNNQIKLHNKVVFVPGGVLFLWKEKSYVVADELELREVLISDQILEGFEVEGKIILLDDEAPLSEEEHDEESVRRGS